MIQRKQDRDVLDLDERLERPSVHTQNVTRPRARTKNAQEIRRQPRCSRTRRSRWCRRRRVPRIGPRTISSRSKNGLNASLAMPDGAKLIRLPDHRRHEKRDLHHAVDDRLDVAEARAERAQHQRQRQRVHAPRAAGREAPSAPPIPATSEKIANTTTITTMLWPRAMTLRISARMRKYEERHAHRTDNALGVGKRRCRPLIPAPPETPQHLRQCQKRQIFAQVELEQRRIQQAQRRPPSRRWRWSARMARASIHDSADGYPASPAPRPAAKA